MILVKLGDVGDAIVANLKNDLLNEQQQLPVFSVREIKGTIAEEARQYLGHKPFFLGGDDGVCYDLLKALSGSQNAGALLLDSHLPAALARIGEERLIRPENLIVLGLHSTSTHDSGLMKSVRTYPMREITREGLNEVCGAAMSVAKNFGSLFVGISMDVVDPAFAPGVIQPVPAGLTSRELVHCLQRIMMLKNLTALGLYGIDLAKDNDQLTLRLAAKLVTESY